MLVGSCRSATPPAAADPWGPYAVGVMSVAVAGSVAEIWYPAAPAAERAARQAGATPDRYDIRDWLPARLARRVTPGEFSLTTRAFRDLPVAPGSHPLVLFAHGLYSFPEQSTGLTTWLASWGYAVAAPDLPVHDLRAYFDYTARGFPLPSGPTDEQVLTAVVTTLRQQSQAATGPLAGRVATADMAVIGHSQGGIDAMAFASSPAVRTYIPLAAGFAGSHPALPAVPSLWMAAGDDHDVSPDLVRRVYATAAPPKRLVVLARSGHLAFTDLCLINPDHGGLGALAPLVGSGTPPGAPFTSSALDGCGAGFAPPATSLAQIRSAILSDLSRWLPASG